MFENKVNKLYKVFIITKYIYATKYRFLRQINDRWSNYFDISIQFHVHLATFRYLRMNYV